MDAFASLIRGFLYAFRSLSRSPGLVIAVILTLAIGIGANTAIFSVLEGVVLDPLPFPQPDRLVIAALYNRTLGYPTLLSYPDFLDWQRDAKSFDQLAAYANQGFDLTSPGAAEHLDGQEVSSTLFSTLKISLALGRGFSPEEDRIGGTPAVIISDRVWHDRFGRNPAALGKNLTLNGVDYTVIGILGPGFHFGDQKADVYTPIAQRNPLYIKDRSIHDIACVGRLRPQISVSQALAEMNTIQEHIGELNPATERGQGAWVVPLKDFLIGDVSGTLMLLLGAVGVVLLIACTNVANLLLARSAARVREFAIRLAMGATRARIVRQLITESLLLSMAGGVLGLLIVKPALAVILAAAPGNVPRVANIAVNTPVLLFAFGISLLVGITFGLVPALKNSKTDIQTGLRESGRGVAGGHQRTQKVLVVLQVALAVVLLSGGGLLFRTIQNLWAVNPGFNPQHVTTFQVGLAPAVTSTPAKLRASYQELVDRLGQIPGVEAADITALVPLSHGANEGPFWVGPNPPASMAQIPRAIYYPTGPDYVRAMQIPLLSGRTLSRTDTLNSDVVVLVDTLLAQRFFPAQNAVGRFITIPHWGAAHNMQARIVGVVGHVEHYGLDGSIGEKPQIYYSFYQLPDEVVPVFRSDITAAVRARSDADALMPALRKAVDESGGNQPIFNVRTMQDLVSQSMGRQRFPMLLLVAFAVVALLLALVGIHGVISYWTIRRTKEIGIRMALGARKLDVVQMVLQQALKLALIGATLGTAATLALRKVLSQFTHLLYGVQAYDPAVIGTVALILIGGSILACYIPARHAAGLEPTAGLRED